MVWKIWFSIHMYAWDLNYMTKWKWIFSENECLNWNQCIRDYIELIATYTFVDLARKWQSGAWVLIRINLWSYFFNCVSFCCTKLAPGCCSQPFSTSVLKNLILNFVTLSGYVRILATCTGTATWQKSMAVSQFFFQY